MEIQAAITKTFWLYTTAVAILISKEYKICCTIYLWASNSGLSTTKMFLNITFSFLLFLSSSYSLKTEKQGLCSPPVVEPSPVQHLWAEDGLEVYRIFLAVLAALYLHRWLTEWLMIHHLERWTWQCVLIWSDNLQLACVFGIFGHIWHIWARAIWSSGCPWKRYCKMQFRRVGLRSIGPSSQKLWPSQIFGRFPHCNYNVKLQSSG